MVVVYAVTVSSCFQLSKDLSKLVGGVRSQTLILNLLFLISKSKVLQTFGNLCNLILVELLQIIMKLLHVHMECFT